MERILPMSFLVRKTILTPGLPNGPRPTPANGVLVAAWHQPSGLYRNKPQRAHGRADAARIAGGLRHAKQVEQSSSAYAVPNAAHNIFNTLPKRIGITFSEFSLCLM